jgi:hypothetical protein
MALPESPSDLYAALTVQAEELLCMNESVHGERTASELQDRVTELIEQQTAISEVLRAIASSAHDVQPIPSTPSSTAPHVSVEQTEAAYVSPKKAAFDSWRCEGTPFGLVRRYYS